MHFFRTHQKLLMLLLVGVFFSVPLVTHADKLGSIIVSTVGFILWIGAKLFDTAISELVLNMGALIRTTTGESINVVWTVVRDLVNLTFIFGLVYVGIKTILDAGTDTKKLLSSIIIGALLVNFSLFISKVVIDVSNITASEIYKAMKVGSSATGQNYEERFISTQFLIRMGIMDLVTVSNQDAKTKIGSLSADSSLAFIVGASIFILVAAFVFAAGALLLVIRFGVLIILMMLSPVAFAATVFPAFKGWRDKWWHTLFSQAFFAPAYLFMIYATLIVGSSYKDRVGSFDQIYSNTGAYQNGFTKMAFFCLTIVMMVASLILAKQMGAMGATKALAVGNKLGSLARRGALYPVRAVEGMALREGSRRLRKLEAAGGTRESPQPWLKSQTVGAVMRGIKRVPFVTRGLQVAGTAANTYLATRKAEMAKLRNPQKKRLLDSLGSPLSPLDRLAIYQSFQDSGDIDELSVDELQDYEALLRKYELGTNALYKLRPDVVSVTKDDAELRRAHRGKITRIKTPTDFAALHKIIVSRTDPLVAKDKNGRVRSLNAMLDAMVDTFNGSVFAAAARRGDNVSQELLKKLRERVVAGVDGVQFDATKASGFVGFFEALAAKETDEDIKQRNLSAADEFKKSAMARLVSIQSDVERPQRRARLDDDDENP